MADARRMGDRELSRALARHYDALELFANGAAEDAVLDFQRREAAVKELIREAVSRLQAQGGAKRDLPTAEYIALVKRRLEEIRNDVMEECLELLSAAVDAAARAQGGFLPLFMAAAGMAAAVELGDGDYMALLDYGFYGADTRRELLARIIDGDVSRLSSAFERAVRDGVPLPRALEMAEDEMLKTRRYVKGAVEAAVNGAANDASVAFAQANGLSLLYSAVMDSHVCEECAALDGTAYAPDDPGIPYLPRHINCRCELIPVAPGREGVGIEPFAEYAESLPDDERRERLGGKDAGKGYVPPPEGSGISAKELERRDKRIFG